MQSMKWPVTVTAETTMPNGKRRRMHRVVEGIGDVEGAMLRAVQARRDSGYPFYGCEIKAITPLGQSVIRILNPDTGKLEKE